MFYNTVVARLTADRRFVAPALMALIALTGCLDRPEAERIFTGGNIVTANPARPEVEALATRHGRILAVGNREEVLAHQSADTEVIELDGRALLPGFIDPHTHPVSRQVMQELVDVGPFTHDSMASVRTTLKQASEQGPVVAFGYDPSLMEGNPQLDFDRLDRISTEVPILVINLSGHIAYGNSKLFAKAGITDDTPDPEGGRFVRDEQGRLTGVAQEVSAVTRLATAVKDEVGDIDYQALTRKTLTRYADQGFTTITVPGLGMAMPSPEAHIKHLRKAARREDAPARVQGYVKSSEKDRMQALVADNDPRFRVLGMKLWADGSTQGYTAALEAPYKGRSSRGEANYSQQRLNELVASAHREGYQVAVHANGDRAMAMTLNAYARAQDETERDDPRHRMEHCTVGNRALLHRAEELGVTCSFLNQHVYVWGTAFRDDILGAERAAHLDPAGTAERLGMRFTVHDDAPTGQPDPMLMIETAVTRQMRDGGVLNADERVPIDRAIRALTLDAAWQTHAEQDRGSLESGKYADLVMLDANPRKTDPADLSDIEVLKTWVADRAIEP